MKFQSAASGTRWLADLFGTSGSLRGQLVRGGIGGLAIKIAYAVLGVALTVVLARVLGPEGYGVYALALAIVTVIAIPAQCGLPSLVVREVAKYALDGQWALLRGILTRANQIVALASLFLALLAGATAWSVYGDAASIDFRTFAWALIVMPIIALGNLRAAALRGFGKVVQGQLPEFLVVPMSLLALALIASSLSKLAPYHVMGLHAAAGLIAFATGAVLLFRALPRPMLDAVPAHQTKTWLYSALSLSLVAGMEVVNAQANVLLLGFLQDSGDVGLYRVAAQGAALVAFTLNAVCIAVAPYISRLYHTRELARLQRIVTTSSRLVLYTSLPVASLLILFGDEILAFAFGAAYRGGHEALAILCAGQLVHAAMGPVTFILNMTGHERDTVRGMAVGTGVNIALSLSLIPFFGLAGAATANAVTYLAWNVILWRAVRVRLGIESSAIGPALLRATATRPQVRQ